MIVAEEVIGAKEAGKMLGVHPRTVVRLAERGEIKAFRVGDLWRFRRTVIEDYIREQEEKQQQGGRASE